MSSSVLDTIRQAIRGKQQISAYYDGYYRELCPHALGVKGGSVWNVLSVQVGGESGSRGMVTPSTRGWTSMHVHELSGVTVIQGNFYTLDNHTQPSTCFDLIDTEVDF